MQRAQQAVYDAVKKKVYSVLQRDLAHTNLFCSWRILKRDPPATNWVTMAKFCNEVQQLVSIHDNLNTNDKQKSNL